MKLALGSAQFGLPYGARKRSAAVSLAETGRMLNWGWDNGIDMIDTAPAYGEAERVISQVCPTHAKFKFVTKTTRCPAPEELGSTIDTVRRSYDQLGGKTLWSVLVHQASDLTSNYGALLFKALEALRTDGITQRVGVSVYDPQTLDVVLSDFPIEVVQLPLNVLDQRFEQAGSLDKLTKRGIEIHTRSSFLQGMLLTEPPRLPKHFESARPQIDALRRDAAEAGLDLTTVLFAYAKSCHGISRVIVGADSLDDLIANHAAFNRAIGASFDFSKYAVNDLDVIDPRRWPQ